MKDSFDREIRYLRISLTDRCNLRCIYCMPKGGIVQCRRQDILSLEEILSIAQAAVELGVRKIRLTGGEPLLCPGILSLCNALAALPGLEELSLTTNGCLLAPLAADLKAAGLHRVNLSLDSLDPEKYRRITQGGQLSQALSGIRAALAAGLPLKINTVLLGGINEDEIGALAALSQTHPLSLRFIELMPLGGARTLPPAAYVPCRRVLEILPQLEPLEEMDGVARLYRLPNARGTVGLISPLSHSFCPDCDRIRLTADGFLKPCLHGDLEIPLRGLTGPALRQALQSAILQKPKCHGALSPLAPSPASRGMNQIGG